MKVSSHPFKNFTDKNSHIIKYDTVKENKQNIESQTLKGYLLNNNIKKEIENKDYKSDFDRISSNLLITDVKPTQIESFSKEEDFDMKKVLKPLAITSLSIISGVVLISMLLKGYSNKLLNKADLIQPEDLARNVNIKEEPDFAMFRALREPNKENILGLLGVGLMSGFTLAAKSFVDGFKEIWIKKCECDISHNLQKDLIRVETEAFSGKLNVVNTLLNDTNNYFKEVFSINDENISFKGNEDKKEEKKQDENNKKEKYKNIALISLGVLSSTFLAFFMFRNFQKSVSNLNSYEENLKNKLIKSDKLEIFSLTNKKEALEKLKNVLIATKASKKTILEDVSKIKGITQKEIDEFVQKMEDLQIYSNADKAMYGTSGKIQYYCYINDNRGHLYNWILNPDNKFNKYLFLALSAISSIGYISNSLADALKSVAVNKENSKSELNLRKKLVEVEVENFKAKKLSAINPLIEDFKHKLKTGKSKEELLPLAENILIEIKNGPPYVYA